MLIVPATVCRRRTALDQFFMSSSMSVCLDLVQWTVSLFSVRFLVLFVRVHVHIFVSCSRLPCRCIDVVLYWADEGFDCLFNWLLEAPYKSFLHVFLYHSWSDCHEEHSNFLNLLIHCLSCLFDVYLFCLPNKLSFENYMCSDSHVSDIRFATLVQKIVFCG